MIVYVLFFIVGVTLVALGALALAMFFVHRPEGGGQRDAPPPSLAAGRRGEGRDDPRPR